MESLEVRLRQLENNKEIERAYENLQRQFQLSLRTIIGRDNKCKSHEPEKILHNLKGRTFPTLS